MRGAVNEGVRTATLSPGHEPPERPREVRADLVEYLVIAFPDRAALGSVVPALTDIVRSEHIRVLDIAVLARAADGALEMLEVGDVDALAGLGALDVDLGLLSENDLRLAAGAVRPGEFAVVLVAEDRWAEQLSRAVRGAGGEIAAGERMAAVRVEAALADRQDDDRGR